MSTGVCYQPISLIYIRTWLCCEWEINRILDMSSKNLQQQTILGTEHTCQWLILCMYCSQIKQRLYSWTCTKRMWNAQYSFIIYQAVTHSASPLGLFLKCRYQHLLPSLCPWLSAALFLVAPVTSIKGSKNINALDYKKCRYPSEKWAGNSCKYVTLPPQGSQQGGLVEQIRFALRVHNCTVTTDMYIWTICSVTLNSYSINQQTL